MQRLSLKAKNVFFLMLHIRAFLAFEDDTAGFEGLEFVPNTFRAVNAVDAVFLAEDDAVDDGAVIVVCC